MIMIGSVFPYKFNHQSEAGIAIQLSSTSILPNPSIFTKAPVGAGEDGGEILVVVGKLKKGGKRSEFEEKWIKKLEGVN